MIFMMHFNLILPAGYFKAVALFRIDNITYMSERKYTFVVEWFDPSASIIKQFYFTYFMPGQQI